MHIATKGFQLWLCMVFLLQQYTIHCYWFDQLPDETLATVPKIILQNEKHYPQLKDLYLQMVGKTSEWPVHVARARKLQKTQKIIPDSIEFPCNTTLGRSAERPTSVHKLRPGDIDIVAAMGDSLTAGNGGLASAIPHISIENRGVTTMIGGQGNWRQFLTLPNIIKEFNPKLFGYSLSDSFTHHSDAQFNIGEIAAMTQDLPFMTRQLVKKIKKDPRVDFNNDWKMITLLLGANNFCLDLCYLPDAFTSVETRRQTLIKSFEFLRDNMPRTIVNLMISPNLKVLIDFKGVKPSCHFLHLFECPCLYALQYRHRRDEFVHVMHEWQKVEEEVVNDERFRTKEDFAVVFQPFTKNISFPVKRNAAGEVVSDLSYLSEDCFHFSQKGYSRASNALWNNMFEPVGSKSINWPNEFEKFLCPTDEHPYIYTWKNSIP